MWLALEDESLWSWLGHAQSLETPAMSSVIWTCQNDLGLNLCVVPPTSRMVAISENSLIRRGVKHIAIDTRDLVSTFSQLSG